MLVIEKHDAFVMLLKGQNCVLEGLNVREVIPIFTSCRVALLCREVYFPPVATGTTRGGAVALLLPRKPLGGGGRTNT